MFKSANVSSDLETKERLLETIPEFSPPAYKEHVPVAAQKAADTLTEAVFSKKNVEIGLYILCWYFFSILISVYNKWMFGLGLDFRFPILITSFHQLVLFVLSLAVLYVKPHLRPERRVHQGSVFARLFSVGFITYVKQIFPCAFVSAGDIGVLNLLLMFISLSLYTMLKTCTIMFVLLFGLLFRLELFSWRLTSIVSLMTFSVVLMVNKGDSNIDTENSPTGIVLVLAALMILGLRWNLTQLLLKKNSHTSNPIASIFSLSPLMSLVLFFFGGLVEGWDKFTASAVWETYGVYQTIGMLIVPGVLAFMMTLCQFRLLQVTQVTTLCVASIFREVLTIFLGLVIFGDTISFINAVGLVLTFVDILWYNWFRYEQGKKQTDTKSLDDLL